MKSVFQFYKTGPRSGHAATSSESSFDAASSSSKF